MHVFLYLFTVEDQNFALFNYVNELNNEIEFVQEQIQEVHNYCKYYNIVNNVLLDTARS